MRPLKIAFFTMTYWLALVPVTVLITFPILLMPTEDKSFKIARWWGVILFWLSGSTVEVEGLENIDPDGTYVYAANHLSEFDIYLLFMAIPQPFYWISKPIYFKIPFLGWCLKKTGCISMDRKKAIRSREALDEAIQKIKQNKKSVAVFPEGTRSEDGELQRFKRGSILISTEGKIPIVPVTIEGTHKLKSKGRFWVRPQHVTVKFSEPIPIEGEGKEYQKKVKNELKNKIEKQLTSD